jgi:acyl-CoA thioester hydrolase
MTHKHNIRVYYEDVDLAGIVYYANYLKFIERGRSEWVRSLGIDQGALRAERGVVFAVRRLVADYLAAARFADEVCVETSLRAMTGARIALDQRVLRGEAVLFSAEVVLVCLGGDGRAVRVPSDIRMLLATA